ncbi:aminotransferase class III-fold pyridoxal phosphate-dependent enzyme [Streptomyces sp. TRM43335]|uniref:Aminotransferase class III-fold pyridoxal phosphate-dependent enzyme n=1 Tax=Streptomyces taklimakanensis TaxID=2569853 RepID=A0A6G2BID8_9ACTN|nr:daptide-type RiPP biosynthesis aminotransferase [Streptomyces taklimakanensis]MTE21823.1 aminotransferase class III-fold pyridoxal phosphate-dependent enzyme [Streptomyces taklimakanensis]
MSTRQALWPSLLPPELQGDDSLCAVSAEGVRVRFADGRELLCGTSGLWNCNLGYGNPAIADAVATALREASYLTLFRYESACARQAADALVDLCGAEHYGRVLFSTSGGAANDLVMKVARLYHALRGEPRRKVVVGLRGGYHGLTFGSFALTGEDLGQPVYGVDQRLVRHVTPNDTAELATLLGRQADRIAAVVVEPVLGSGAIPLEAEYVAELLRLREEHGFLLVADEVATGFGRTGSLFASQRWPEPPDLLVASKGLTNGTMAAATVVVSRGVAAAFDGPGTVLTHGETQAGAPATCAAILATIEEMRRLDAVALGRNLAERLDRELESLVAERPEVTGTTGVGCFRAVRLAGPDGAPLPHAEVPKVVAAIREAGAIVHPGPHCVQLFPALTYTEADLAELMERVRAGLAAHAAGLAARAAAPDRPVPSGARG